MNRRLFLLSVLVATTASADQTTWTSFQNGGRIAVDTDGKPWAHQVFTAWTTDIEGHGQSSPVVWREHVYATTTIGENKETYRVVAMDAQQGEVIWSRDLTNPSPRANNDYVSRAAPTPVVDADGVVVLFEEGAIGAWTHDGEERWSRDLVADYGPIASRHGLSASLEQDDEHVFVWVERDAEPYVAALRKSDGQTVWKVPGVGANAWSSPRLIDVETESHLVLSANGSIVGLAPATGKTLWRLDGLSGNSSPTPMPVGDGAFLIGASSGRSAEVADGVFESNGLVRMTRDGDQWSAALEWSGKRASVSFATPMVADGVAYFVGRGGVVHGLDVASGDALFTKRLDGTVWGTPVVLGDVVVFPVKDGALEFVAAGETFDSLSVHRLFPKASADGPGGRFGGPTIYGLAFAGGRLFVRSGTSVICVAPTYE